MLKKLLTNRHLLFNIEGNIYKLDLSQDISDISNDTLNLPVHVHSIALGNPSLKNLPQLKSANMSRLDFFCPTYDLLRRYKQYNIWSAYVKDYQEIMMSRKSQISQWVESLSAGSVYVLCCWENTIKKSHCHRDLLYLAFRRSQFAMQYIYPIYRSGNRLSKSEIEIKNNIFHVINEKAIIKILN